LDIFLELKEFKNQLKILNELMGHFSARRLAAHGPQGLPKPRPRPNDLTSSPSARWPGAGAHRTEAVARPAGAVGVREGERRHNKDEGVVAVPFHPRWPAASIPLAVAGAVAL
jgi:hypothetical protein